MRSFHVEHLLGRDAFVTSVEQFQHTVDAVSEWDLLGESLCHGWTRLDVVTHVLAGWQELLGAFASPSQESPTVDAASYWSTFRTENTGTDPVVLLLAQRRKSDAYTRPSVATGHLRDVAADVVRGARSLTPRAYGFQGQVLTSGDLLATWAVENVVHHLDLVAAEPVPPTALRLARETCDALLPRGLPGEWSDRDVVLVATGRTRRDDTPADCAAWIPVL